MTSPAFALYRKPPEQTADLEIGFVTDRAARRRLRVAVRDEPLREGGVLPVLRLSVHAGIPQVPAAGGGATHGFAGARAPVHASHGLRGPANLPRTCEEGR